MIIIANDEKKYVRTAFLNKGILFKIEQLIIGDFIIGNIIIERKQINDLYQSLNKGTLFRQLEKIRDFTKLHSDAKPLLLIEGTKVIKKLRRFTTIMPLEDIMGNALVEFNISVIRTDNLDQTVNFINQLNNYSFKDVQHIIKDIRGYKPTKSVKAQQKYFLQGLPTIGIKRVESIMNTFSSPMEYFIYMIQQKPKTIPTKILMSEMNGNNN